MEKENNNKNDDIIEKPKSFHYEDEIKSNKEITNQIANNEIKEELKLIRAVNWRIK